MSIDPSSVASILGVQVSYRDLRGGNAAQLPQQIAIAGQGESAVTYPTTKWLSTSAAATGARYGYRSPLYLAHKELQPLNGDGVGSVPVWILPLSDHASGVAAAGSITPSGTTTKQTSYNAKVAGILGEAFTLPSGAIDVTDACRKIRESVENKLGMPVVATNSYGTVTASAVTGAGDGTVTTLSATGTPLPGDYTLTCITAAMDAGTFKLVDPNGNTVSVSVEVTGSPQEVGGITFTLTDGAADFEAGDFFTITVPATNVVLTSSWKGASANDIEVEIVATESVGAVFTIVQPTGGLNNPSVSTALSAIGEDWVSMLLNCLEVADTTALDAYQNFAEPRWDSQVHKPLVCFTGNTDVSVNDATVVTSARTSDRVNSLIACPGSPNLPFVVAARALARIASVANNNPAVDYVRQKLDTLTPGTDAEQWDWATRDLANKRGCSTVIVEDSVVYLGDVVTMWRPSGEDPPAYANVVTIVKLQQLLYNLALKFQTTDWAAAPLISDDDVTTNPAARKPKHAKSEVNDVIDGLADLAVLVDRETSKQSVTAVISSSNPNRLDIAGTVRVSGNTKIKNLDIGWGFNFGSTAAA